MMDQAPAYAAGDDDLGLHFWDDDDGARLEEEDNDARVDDVLQWMHERERDAVPDVDMLGADVYGIIVGGFDAGYLCGVNIRQGDREVRHTVLVLVTVLVTVTVTVTVALR